MTAPQPPADDLSLLDGRYRLETVVGRGGYARVYRATDESLGRRVAIKLFTVETPDERDRQRRESETRLLAGLSHESLVTLFDARLDVDPAYIVMEYVDGPTLTAVLANAPLTPSDAARLAGELGEALQVIHAAGVVHRDIKPSNVMMRPSRTEGGSDRALLADFGIASLVDSARLTATGTLVGTAAYLSPEQARGNRAGAASDVYSLGLLLLEALTGHRAFAQNTPHEALAARLARPPAIPADLPADWRGLLSAMTAIEPNHRPDAAAVTRAARRLQGTDAAPSPVAVPPRAVDMPTEALPATRTDSVTARMDAPTARMDAETTPVSAPTVGLDPVTAVLHPETPTAARTGLPRWIWWVIAVLAITAGATGIAIAVASGAAPVPEPTFPPLPDPLNTRFDELWRTL